LFRFHGQYTLVGASGSVGPGGVTGTSGTSSVTTTSGTASGATSTSTSEAGATVRHELGGVSGRRWAWKEWRSGLVRSCCKAHKNWARQGVELD